MTVKIGITIEASDLEEIDQLVAAKVFPNRSKVIQQAISDKLLRLKKTRLAIECEKLDAEEERQMAEEWADGEIEMWAEVW